MSNTEVSSGISVESDPVAVADLKLEVVVIPVSDVDRAKNFYTGLGWRLDADFATAERLPGRAGDPARLGLLGHLRHQRHGGRARLDPGPAPDRLRHRRGAGRAGRAGCRRQRGLPRRGRGLPPRRRRWPGQRAGPGPRELRLVRRVRRPGRQRLAAPGDHDPAARPDRPGRNDVRLGRPTWRARCAAPPPPTASTRPAPDRPTRTGRTGTPTTWSRSRRGRPCRNDRDFDVIVLGGGSPGEHCAGGARRGRPAGRAGRTRAGRRRVLLLGLHPVQDAAAARVRRCTPRARRPRPPRSTSRRRSPGATSWSRTTPTPVRSAGSPTTGIALMRGDRAAGRRRARSRSTGSRHTARQRRAGQRRRPVHAAGARAARARRACGPTARSPA